MAKKPNKNRQTKNNEEDTQTNLSNNVIIINESSEILVKESSNLNNNFQSNVNLNTKNNMNNLNLKEKNSSKENLCKEEIVEGFSFLTFLSYNDLEKSVREKDIINKEQNSCKLVKAQNDNHQSNNLLSICNTSNINVNNKKKQGSKDSKESQSSNVGKSNCSILTNSKNNCNSNNSVFNSNNINNNTNTSINSNSSSSFSNKSPSKNCKEIFSKNNNSISKIKPSNINEKGENEILKKKKLSKESNNVKDLSGNSSNKDIKNSEFLNKEKSKSIRSKSTSPASGKSKNKDEKFMKNEDSYKANTSNSSLSSFTSSSLEKNNKSKNKEKIHKKQDDFKKEKSKKDNDHRVKKLFKDDQDNHQSKKRDKKEKFSENNFGESESVCNKEISEKKKLFKDKSKPNLKSSSLSSIKESTSSPTTLNKSSSSSSLTGTNCNSEKLNKKNYITSENLSAPNKKKKQKNNLQSNERKNSKDEKEFNKKVSENSSGKNSDNVKKLKTNSDSETDLSDLEKNVALKEIKNNSSCLESLKQINDKEDLNFYKNNSNNLNGQSDETNSLKSSVKILENDRLENLSQSQNIKNENNLNLLKENVNTAGNLVPELKKTNCNIDNEVNCLESINNLSSKEYQSSSKKTFASLPDPLSINNLSSSSPATAVLNNNPFLQPPTNLSQVSMFDPIFSSNSRNLLRQELNNRFLASSQERPNMFHTSPFLRPEFLMPPFMFNKFDFTRPPATVGLKNSFPTSLSPKLRTSTPTTNVSSSLPTRSNSVTPNTVLNNPSSNCTSSLNTSEGLSSTRPSSTNSTLPPQIHSSTHNLGFPFLSPQSHAAFQPKSNLNSSNNLAPCSFSNNLNKSSNSLKKGIKTGLINMQTDNMKSKSFKLKMNKWCSMHLSIAKEIDNQQNQSNDKNISLTKDFSKQGTIKSSKNITPRTDNTSSLNPLAIPKSSLKSINNETHVSSNLASAIDGTINSSKSSIVVSNQMSLPSNMNLTNSVPSLSQFHPPSSNESFLQNAFSLANMSNLNNNDLMKGMNSLLNLNSNNNLASNISNLQSVNMTIPQLANSTTTFSSMNSSIPVQSTFSESLTNRFNSFPNPLLAANNKDLQISFCANNSSSQLAANSAMFLRPGLPAFGLPHTSPSNTVSNSIHHQNTALPSNNGLPISAANNVGLTCSNNSANLNPLFANEIWSRARMLSPLLNSVGVPPQTSTPNSNWPLIKTDSKYLTGISSNNRISKDNQLKSSSLSKNNNLSSNSESSIMKNFENGLNKNSKLPTPTSSPSKNNNNNLSATVNPNNFSVPSNMFGYNSNQQSYLQRPSSRHHNSSLHQQTIRSNRRDIERQNYKRDHSLSPINHNMFANQANNFHNSLYHANKLQKLNESPLSKTGNHVINSYQNGFNHLGSNTLAVAPHLMSLQNTLPNAQSSTSSRLPSVSINASMNPSSSNISSMTSSNNKLSEDHRMKLSCLPSNSVLPTGFHLSGSNELNLLHHDPMALERARMLSVLSSLPNQSNPSNALSSNTNTNYSVLAGLPSVSQSNSLNNPLLQHSIHGVPTSSPYQNTPSLPSQSMPLHSRINSNSLASSLTTISHPAALANLANNSALAGSLQFNSNDFQATTSAMKYLNPTTMYPSLHPAAALSGSSSTSLITPQSNHINLNLNHGQSLIHSIQPDLSNPFKNLSEFTRSGFGEREQLFNRYSILNSSGGGAPLTDKLAKDNSEKRVFVSS